MTTVTPSIAPNEKSEVATSARCSLSLLILSSLAWLILGGVLAVIHFVQVASPAFLADCPWLTVGHVQALQETTLIYGWAANVGLAVALWLLSRLGAALGGKTETFMGLSGLGDLLLTCTGDLSRNRRVGLAMAAGQPLDTVLGTLGHVAEGVATAREVLALSQRIGVDMPITAAVCAILFDNIPASSALDRLLHRSPRAE